MTSNPFDLTQILHRIQIVMVNTTLPANIGAALRAMKTMGLRHLTLVAPKYPVYQDHEQQQIHPDILALSAGAYDLIPSIRVVDHFADAIADCHVVFGTSARTRNIQMPLLDARPACEKAIELAQHYTIAIVFGREDRGLTNDELAQCNYHLTIPVNPDYGVLNVAQAIQVVCYELRMSALTVQPSSEPIASPTSEQALVNQQQMQHFYDTLEQTLSQLELLDLAQPRLMPLRLRRLFGRIQLEQVEYQLLTAMLYRTQHALRQPTQPKNPKPVE